MPNRSLLVEWRQRWNRSLFQFLRRRVRSSVDVQDLAQETYLRLLRARDLNEVRNPLAYLLQVASHVALEWCDQQPRGDSTAVLYEDIALVWIGAGILYCLEPENIVWFLAPQILTKPDRLFPSRRLHAPRIIKMGRRRSAAANEEAESVYGMALYSAKAILHGRAGDVFEMIAENLPK
jgi:hypothetical protein